MQPSPMTVMTVMTVNFIYVVFLPFIEATKKVRDGLEKKLRFPRGAAIMVALLLVLSSYVITFVGSLALTIFVVVWPGVLVALWELISKAAAQALLVRIVAAGSCIIIGLLLFLARTRMPGAYALAEIVVGVAACWVGFGIPPDKPLPGALALVGGLYGIVIGIGNLIEALKKPR